ncbi:hypothetical protein I3215_23075 [Streptomyces sp. RB110-1]|uniref:hypothetical protein n=1 Tax=unclassified Streptomyces TaxID=2593676 RepID=UPI00190103EE|nr:MULTISPECIES: hypothetical protein [unclassified Streptomyces]MBK0375732.1 hypothetical protein [Streptomyces sp. RB110-1]MBK0387894.1 hypothetical protein [Streptomyces sp. RB110-2]
MTEHWLYRWIDEFEIKSGDQAGHLLALPGPAEKLHEAAKNIPKWQAGDPPKGKSIVAGSTMDFSGRMNCSHAECLMRQVDHLFGRVWHYFDSAVVEGPQASFYVRSLENSPSRQGAFGLSYSVAQDVDFLLHLRRLGIADHLIFRSKPHGFCTNHIEQHAAEAGISHLIDGDGRAQIAKQLKAESEILIRQSSDKCWRYVVNHPSLSEPFIGSYVATKKKNAKKPTKAQIAEVVVKRSVASLIYDVATCKWLSLPLAEEFSYLRASEQVANAARESSVALQVPMPVMRGMTSGDIVKMRADMRPHFDRFQHALTLAIREQIERDPERANPDIAKSITEEFIRPSFAEIERSLLETKRSFSVKVGASMAVGSTVATVGLLSSVPLVIGAGLAAVGVTLGGLHKHVDDRKDIATSDIYFLWKASKGRLP